MLETNQDLERKVFQMETEAEQLREKVSISLESSLDLNDGNTTFSSYRNWLKLLSLSHSNSNLSSFFVGYSILTVVPHQWNESVAANENLCRRIEELERKNRKLEASLEEQQDLETQESQESYQSLSAVIRSLFPPPLFFAF